MIVLIFQSVTVIICYVPRLVYNLVRIAGIWILLQLQIHAQVSGINAKYIVVQYIRILYLLSCVLWCHQVALFGPHHAVIA